MIDLADGSLRDRQAAGLDWRVGVIDTGIETMTAGRILRLRPLIGDEPFMVTYGDGLGDVDLAALLAFHRSTASSRRSPPCGRPRASARWRSTEQRVANSSRSRRRAKAGSTAASSSSSPESSTTSMTSLLARTRAARASGGRSSS